METINNNGQNNTPPEFKKYYSSDPYEVLGISRNATKEEVDQARKQLRIQFHPDRNKDPEALKIFQNVEEAFNKINPKPKQEDKDYVNEEDVFKYLYEPSALRRFTAQAQDSGIKTWQILELLESDKGQEKLKQEFSRKLESYLIKPQDLLKYIEEWKDQGVNVEKFLDSTEVLALLEKNTFRIPEQARDFEVFVAEWKQLNIDITPLVASPKFKAMVETRAGWFFENKVYSYEPKKVTDYLDGWKKFGLLGNILSEPKISQLIETQLGDWYVSPSSNQKDSYQLWVSKGWKPSEKLISRYNQKPIDQGRLNRSMKLMNKGFRKF
jgi:curved DNA-binding protein CbpA